MRLLTYPFIIFALFALYKISQAAEPITGELQRAEQVINDQQISRQQIEKTPKTFIKTIRVKGSTLLSVDDIKAAISMFEGNWLGENEILQVIDSLKHAYETKGVGETFKDAEYKLNKDILEIQIRETNNQKDK